MSRSHNSTEQFNRLYISAFMIALVVALSVLVVLQFAHKQYQNDVQGWQVKLSLIADSRLNAVDSWLEDQFAEMRDLAQNDAVVRYVEQGENSGIDTPTQEVYLRHLLSITAERSGFSPDTRGQMIGENVVANGGGVALLNMDGNAMVATVNMPPLQGALKDFVAAATPAEPNMMDMAVSVDGAPLRMGFMVPVYAAQSGAATSSQIGWVFGVREVGEGFFNVLRHPGVIEASLETLLVREENGGVTYLSPLVDGTKPLRKHMAIPDSVGPETALAAAYAVKEPGQFAVHNDYRQHATLVTGRNVPGTNWSLLTKVDEDEALAQAKSHRNGLIIQLLLAVAVVFAAVIAAWRHGTSKDATRLATRLETALRKAKTREQMLDVVTNTQPGAIFIVDAGGNCCFANDSFAEQLGLSRQEVSGKKMDVLLGPVLAMEYERASDAALEDQKTIIWTHREKNADGVEYVKRVKHIPLNQLPMERAPAGAKGVLVLEQDITAVVVERERRSRTLRSLVDTLVAMVDRRDPYAANHSVMVATVARETAQEMQLDAQAIETAEIAGTVMNIGKMEVPTEWLTKPGALNEKEHKAIRDSLLESAQMLEGIEFDGPVAETLRQSLENWDGSGPQKLKGDDILVSARIVAAANAFVGMVSPRSYRKALPVDDALNNLMKAIDKEFDRKVVAALTNYIDNHGGRAMIADLVKEPED